MSRRWTAHALTALCVVVALGTPAHSGAEPDPPTDPGLGEPTGAIESADPNGAIESADPTGATEWADPNGAIEPAGASELPGPAEAPIALAKLGRPDTLELLGANTPTRIAVPTPEGVPIARISGQIGSPVNVDTARIEVLDAEGIVLGDIPIPVDAPAADFSLDTTSAPVRDGVLALEFVLRTDDPPVDTCQPTPSITLSRLAATPAGRPPSPTTVADFLPSYLDSITIWTGPEPSRDGQQAALTLTAVLTRNYRPVPVRVDIDTSEAVPVATEPGRRVIAIRDGDTAGIELENPGTPEAVLTIKGRGSDLTDQVALFLDQRIALAQNGSAQIRSLVGQLTPATTMLTFEELGIASSTTFAGAKSIYLGFDTAAFAAGSIEAATVTLRARHTPSMNDQSSVLVRSGAYVLASERLDASGRLDLTFDLPPQIIASDVGMALELQYFPGGGTAGACGPITDQMTFAVDPQSTVEVTPGPVGATGFSDFPADLTPEFDVAVERADLIGYAAQAINLVAARTSVVLRPRLVDLEDGADSGVPLLAVTTGSVLSTLDMSPPVAVGADGTLDFDGTTDAAVRLDGPTAVVQTFADDGRAVLAVTVPDGAGSPDGQDLGAMCLDYIRQRDNGWSSLSGDVVATGAAGDTVNLTIRNRSTARGTPGSRDGSTWSALTTFVIGAVAVFALVRGLMSRRRRKQE